MSGIVEGFTRARDYLVGERSFDGLTNECSVCREDYDTSERIYMFTCNHFVCVDCRNNNRLAANSCPLCSRQVTYISESNTPHKTNLEDLLEVDRKPLVIGVATVKITAWIVSFLAAITLTLLGR